MGNTVSGAQNLVAQSFVPQKETNNNDVPKNPHGFTNTAGMSPPPECPMHVKTDDKKAAGCAVAGNPDDINPLNMVNIVIYDIVKCLNLDIYNKMDSHFIPIESTNLKKLLLLLLALTM